MKHLTLLACLLMLSCGQTQTTQQAQEVLDRNQLESILLNSYLGNSHSAFLYEGSIDELAQFQQLEQLYIQLVEPETKTLSRNDMALLMFYTVYAKQRNNAALNEYLATDLNEYSPSKRFYLAKPWQSLISPLYRYAIDWQPMKSVEYQYLSMLFNLHLAAN